MPKGGEWTRLGVLIGFTLLWSVPQQGGPIDARFDGAVYYILGTSLAQGHGYRLLNEPGEIHAVQYPPLLPLVVAAAQKVLATSDFVVVGSWLRRLYLLLSLALAVGTYRLARKYLAPGPALLAALICVSALHVWYLAGLLYAEIPLALLSVLFVICAGKAERARYWLATAALGVAAYLLRTAGIALLAAWAVEGLLNPSGTEGPAGKAGLTPRLRRAAPRMAVALLAIVAWNSYIASVTSSEEYRTPAYPHQRAAYQYSNVSYVENIRLVRPFAPERGWVTPGGRVLRLVKNLVFVVPSLGGALTTQQGFWLLTLDDLSGFVGGGVQPWWTALVPMAGLGLLVLVGAGAMLRRRRWLLPLCCASTVGVVCLTPWPEHFVRYFTPTTPFLSIMFVTALGVAFRATRPAGPAVSRHRWAGPVLAVLVLGVVCLEDAYVAWWTFNRVGRTTYYDEAGRPTSGRLLFYDARAAALDDALEQVRRRARAGDIVATTMPHWAYLRTGRKAVLPPMETDPDHARRLLDAVPVRYVVLDDLQYARISQRYAAPAVEGHPEMWKRVYETHDALARVYERVR